jgi:hypothetical protein
MYWEDILTASDNLHDYKYEEPAKAQDIPILSIKGKSSLSKELSMT